MTTAIGFIGLGVMGEPMCRNLACKTGLPVFGFDRADAPLQRLAEVGVKRAASLAELATQCDVIFMALPSGKHVQAVCDGDDGLLSHADARHTIVDLGTSPVEASRDLAKRFAAKAVSYADAPIARTRLTEKLPMFEKVKATMEPEHVAPVYVFLASPLASEVSGSVVSVVGGRISTYRVVESVGRIKEADGGIWTPAEIAEHFDSLSKL